MDHFSFDFNDSAYANGRRNRAVGGEEQDCNRLVVSAVASATPWPVSPPPQPANPFQQIAPEHRLGDAAQTAYFKAKYAAVLGRDKTLGVMHVGAPVPTTDYLLSGHAPLGKKSQEQQPGYYLSQGLVLASSLPSIVASVQKDYFNRKGVRLTAEEAYDKIARYHSGVGNDAIHSHCSFAVEIDHLTKEEQIARYQWLSDLTGIRWGAWISSGGKSVHGHIWSSTEIVHETVREIVNGVVKDRVVAPKIWVDIQQMLIVLLSGDPAIKDWSRVMRLGGWHGDERKQPILHLDASPDAYYAPDDLRARLRWACSTQLGIGSDAELETALKAWQLCNAANQAAKSSSTPAWLRAPAAELASRAMAAGVGADQALLAECARLVRQARPKSSTPTLHTSQTRNGTAVEWRDLTAYAGCSHGERVQPPCCDADHDDCGAVYRDGDKLRIRCYRHDVVHIHQAAVAKIATSGNVDSVEAALAVMDEAADRARVVAEVEAEMLERFEQQKADWEHWQTLNFELGERLEERAKAADDVHPDDLEIARRIIPAAKQHWGPLRLRLYGTESYRPCGKAQQIVNWDTGAMQTRTLPCNKQSCRQCGPRLLAGKAFGLAYLPSLQGDDRGHAMATLPRLYRSVFPRRKVDAWLEKQKRTRAGWCALRVVNKWNSDHYDSQGTNVDPVESEPPLWVICDSQTGDNVTVLHQHPVAPPRGWAGTFNEEIIGNLGKVVVDAVLSTYSIAHDEVYGRDVVVGRVRHAKSLRSDPDEIVRIANGKENKWLGLGMSVDPEEAQKIYESEGVKITEVEKQLVIEPGATERRWRVVSVTTEPIDPAVWERIKHKILKSKGQPTPHGVGGMSPAAEALALAVLDW